MKVDWKDPADGRRLAELIRDEGDAKQRDRYRVVLIAGEGLGPEAQLEREAIADSVSRSRQFVDQWVGRYRRGGLEALRPIRQPGATPRLTAAEQKEIVAMLEEGPPPEEGLASYNGPILREKIRERFGRLYSLSGLYALLHRLGYNDLMPRTTHPGTDPAAQEEFKKKSCPSGSGRRRRRTPAAAS